MHRSVGCRRQIGVARHLIRRTCCWLIVHLLLCRLLLLCCRVRRVVLRLLLSRAGHYLFELIVQLLTAVSVDVWVIVRLLDGGQLAEKRS